MVIPHKDLRLILDSVFHFVTLRHNEGIPRPFAVMLTSEGKIARLNWGSDKSQYPKTEVIQGIEAGLSLMAHQGTCTAIGICVDADGLQENRKQIQVVLEHEDGTAYRILLPLVEGAPRHSVYENSILMPLGSRFFTKRLVDGLVGTK